MKSLVFPYGIRFQENGRLEAFPAAEILVRGRGQNGVRAVFIIDSGATTTVLPSNDADILGINLKSGSRIIVRGFGDTSFFGYKHILNMRLGDRSLKVPIIMVEHSNVPRVLGREGVFNHFGILFDEAKSRTGLLDAKKQRETIDSLF